MICIGKKAIIAQLIAYYMLSGCSSSPHSAVLADDVTEVHQVSATKYASHNNRVYVTKANLPATAKYDVLGQIEVGKVGAVFESMDSVLQSMADSARKLGADAVVDVKTWRQPSFGSWFAPHGSGKAVKIIEKSSVDFSNLKGDWR